MDFPEKVEKGNEGVEVGGGIASTNWYCSSSRTVSTIVKVPGNKLSNKYSSKEEVCGTDT